MKSALEVECSPWRPAESLQSCWLFWIPVADGRMLDAQREWLLEFLAQFESRVKTASELRAEHFMQVKTIDADPKLRSRFLNAALKESPLMGLSRYPGEQPPPPVTVPTMKEAEAFASGKRTFRPQDHMPNNACWFTGGDGAQLRTTYLGYGGMTVLFVKPDPEGGDHPPSSGMNGPLIIPKVFRNDSRLKGLLEDFDPKDPTKIPGFLRNHPQMQRMFSMFDMEQVRKKPARLQSGFLLKSKEIFGEGMDRDIVFEARPFILPRLTSAHFFAHTTEQIRRWFEVFDVYIAESPVDGGLIMACKNNLKSLITEIVTDMHSDGYHYWED